MCSLTFRQQTEGFSLLANTYSQSEDEAGFNASHQSTHSYQDDCALPDAPLLAIIVALAPGQQTQECQNLRLDTQSDVEFLSDIINS